MKKLLLLGAIFAICGNLAFGAEEAKVNTKPMRFGGQILYGMDDLNLGIGGRFEMNLDQYYPNLFLASSFNYYFPDDAGGVDLTAWQLSVDAMYNIMQKNTMTFYAGGGFCYDYAKAEYMGVSADDSEVGIEVVGGVKYPISNFTGYSEAKFSIGGFEELIISTGILF